VNAKSLMSGGVDRRCCNTLFMLVGSDNMVTELEENVFGMPLMPSFIAAQFYRLEVQMANNSRTSFQ
jgi:hypothetical protein